MQDAPHREIVQRHAVARAATTAGLRRIGRPRVGRRRRQRLVRQHVAAGAGPLHMRGGPDLRRPFDRLARIIQRRACGHLHRRAERFEAEFLLAPPQHADALVGHLQRDHRRVHRHIVGAVVTVTTGAMRVPHDDSFGRQTQHIGQRRAQRIRPLRVRPHRQHAIAIFRQRTGRAHRRMRDVGARVASPRPRSSAGRSWVPSPCTRSSVGLPTSHAASCWSGVRSAARCPSAHAPAPRRRRAAPPSRHAR